MIDLGELISGDTLKAAALRYLGEMRLKVEREQNGLRSIFDSWFTRVLTQLTNFDPTRSWEDSVQRKSPCDRRRKARACNGICSGCGCFSTAGSRGVLSNFPSANDRALTIIRDSAPSSASTCCSPARALRR